MHLVSEQGAAPLEGVFFNLSPPDNALAAPATQLVVMGRFAWPSSQEGGRFGLRLFGTQADEQTLHITVIHGWGMAEALADLGLQGARKFWSLLGFNLGIELGQLAAAGVAVGVFWALRRWAGASAVAMALRLASWGAMGLGTFWFFQRMTLTA